MSNIPVTAPGPKKLCTGLKRKMVYMYRCHTKDEEIFATKWFYTRAGAEHYGDLQDFYYGVVSIKAPAPTHEDLLLYLLAYKAGEPESKSKQVW